MCACDCVCICICIYVSIHIYICIHRLCMYVYIYMSVCVCPQLETRQSLHTGFEAWGGVKGEFRIAGACSRHDIGR